MESRQEGGERSEGDVFKATGHPFPPGFSGRQTFSSDPRQLPPEAEITRVCLNVQKRETGARRRPAVSQHSKSH